MSRYLTYDPGTQRQLEGDRSLLGTANKHGIVKSSAKARFFRMHSTTQLICHSPQFTKLRVFNTSEASGYLTWDSSDTMTQFATTLFQTLNKILQSTMTAIPCSKWDRDPEQKNPHLLLDFVELFSRKGASLVRWQQLHHLTKHSNGITTTNKYSQPLPCSRLWIHKQLKQSNHLM